MKRDNRLYNVIFPVWSLILFPYFWLIAIPTNFLIDTAVILITLKLMKQPVNFKKYLPVIIQVCIFGFLADFIGVVFLFLSFLISGIFKGNVADWWTDNITNTISSNPFSSIFGLLWVIVAIFIAGYLIYLINLKISFANLNLKAEQKKKLSLSVALFTAPYLFLLPTTWFY